MSDQKKPRFAAWTPEADTMLVALYNDPRWTSHTIAAELLRRFGIQPSHCAVQRRARTLGARKAKAPARCTWTDAMKADVAKLTAKGLSVSEVADHLERRHGQRPSNRAISFKRMEMGVQAFKRQEWTQDADAVLYTHCSTATLRQMSGLIKRATGVRYSDEAVKGRMSRLGLTKRDGGEDRILSDVAAELGIQANRLHRFISYRNLPRRETDYYTYLAEETVEALKEAFPVIPEPVMSTVEAGRLLGFSKSAIHKRIRAGILKAYRFGLHLKVSVSSVDTLRRELGITRPLPQTFGRKDVA